MTETKTLAFAWEDGVEVTVTVRAPDAGRMRLGAIRSALVNHAYLYPLEPPSAARPKAWKLMPWWGCVAVGCGLPALAFAALFAMEAAGGLPPTPPALSKALYGVMLPVFVVLVTAFYVALELKARRFQGKVSDLSSRHPDLSRSVA